MCHDTQGGGDVAKAARGKGEGAVYQARGLWVAVIELPPDAGKRRRRTLYGATKAEALRKLNAARAELERTGDLPSGRTYTLAEWLAVWLANVVDPNVKPSTARTYRSYVDAWIRPQLGHKRLDRLRVEDVESLLAAMSAAGKPESTRAHALAILSRALVVAVKRRHVTRNVVTDLEAKPRLRTRGEGPALTPPQVRAVLEQVEGTPSEGRWWFALVYGLRQGEALGLTWSAVDFDASVLRVEWSLAAVHYVHGCKGGCGKRPASCPTRRLAMPPDMEYRQLNGGLCLVRPKTLRSERMLPLTPTALGYLRRRWVEYLAERAKPGYTDHGLVWPRVNGQPRRPGDDHAEWKALLEEAGVPTIRLHDARHTALSLMQAGGTSLDLAQRVAGHADPAVTRRYSHADLARIADAIEAGERRALEG